MDQFKKPERKSYSNPIEAYNETFNPLEIIKGSKVYDAQKKDIVIGDEVAFQYDRKKNAYITQAPNKMNLELPEGEALSPFQLLTHLRFKNKYLHALNYVIYEHFEHEIPYIRVGTNYFKLVKKKNQYGVNTDILKIWNKESIKDDYGASFLNRIHKFDDFTVHPDNVHYEPIVGGHWNLYEPFPHKPHPEPVSVADIPQTAYFIQHVFGEQQELGYRYFKLLYEYPKQILPVLVLVSKERATGKTSFLNWLDIIFANNYTQISPEDLHNSFNSQYAYKNIIGIDEAVIDRISAVEKIKSIATARTILVNQKMIAQYRIPFYGKFIITTNRESDFMRIDNEEIRFWIRKLDTIPDDKMRSDFFERLIAEVPCFLRYLQDMDTPDFSKSRMVFTREEINNSLLETVKRESRSSLYKDLFIHVQEYFDNNSSLDSFQATLSDIKTQWFAHDNRISSSYIKKVLEEEMHIEKSSDKPIRYQPIYGDPSGFGQKVGRPYTFNRADFSPDLLQPETEKFEQHPF